MIVAKDPTGAGDSFVGGMMGYLATARGPVERNLRRAMVYGSVVASFCCEDFGLKRTQRDADPRRNCKTSKRPRKTDAILNEYSAVL